MSDMAELQGQHNKVLIELYAITKRQEGLRNLFDAAVFIGDGQQAQTLRDQLHGALDTLLDHASSAMTLSRKMFECGK